MSIAETHPALHDLALKYDELNPQTRTKVTIPEGKFGPDLGFVDPLSQMSTLAGRWTFLPINGAAFLLQVMHPVIGDIVEHYSVGLTDSFGRAIRSMDSVQRWFFGGAEAIEEGYRLRKQHQPLQMKNKEGQHISALNPEAYGWVIATSFVTYVDTAEFSLGRPLTAAEKQAGYEQMHQIADIVQVPRGVIPATQEEYWDYYNDMVKNTLVAHPYALALIEAAKKPQSPKLITGPLQSVINVAWSPAGSLLGKTASTAMYGALRPEVRELVNISWSQTDQKNFDRLGTQLRLLYKVLPERIGYTPLAYHSRRLAETLGTMEKRNLPDFAAHGNKKTTKATGCPF